MSPPPRPTLPGRETMSSQSGVLFEEDEPHRPAAAAINAPAGNLRLVASDLPDADTAAAAMTPSEILAMIEADSFFAPFLSNDFDPVRYAHAVTGAQALSSPPLETAAAEDEESGGTAADNEQVQLHLSRLSFAASDVSRHIERLLADRFDAMQDVVVRLDSSGVYLANVLDEIARVSTEARAWHETVSGARNALAQSLGAAREHRAASQLAEALYEYAMQVASLPSPITQLTDVNTVSDEELTRIASTLALLLSSSSAVDFTGIAVYDDVLVPTVAAARGALLARCNAMVHPRDLARAKIALKGLAQVGVLPEWHGLRRAKVVTRIEGEVRAWIEAVAAVDRSVAAAAAASGVNGGAASRSSKAPRILPVDRATLLATANNQLVTFCDVIVSEASFLRSLLSLMPLDTPPIWSTFWSAIAAALTRPLSAPWAVKSPTLAANFPRITSTLGSAIMRIDPSLATKPVQDWNQEYVLVMRAFVPLADAHVAWVEKSMDDAILALFPPLSAPSGSSLSASPSVTRRSNSNLSSSSNSDLASIGSAIPASARVVEVAQSLARYLEMAAAPTVGLGDRVVPLLTRNVTQIHDNIVSAATDAIAVAMHPSSFLVSDADSSQQQRLQQQHKQHHQRVMAASNALYDLGAALEPTLAVLAKSASSEPTIAPVAEQVRQVSEAAHAAAVTLVDALMTAVADAVQLAILSDAANGANVTSERSASWAAKARAVLDTAATLFAPASLRCNPDADAWRVVLVSSLIERIAASVAVAVVPSPSGPVGGARVLDGLGLLEARLADLMPMGTTKVNGSTDGRRAIWDLPTSAHLQALRGALLVDWTAVSAKSDDADEAALASSAAVAMCISRSPVLVVAHWCTVLSSGDGAENGLWAQALPNKSLADLVTWVSAAAHEEQHATRAAADQGGGGSTIRRPFVPSDLLAVANAGPVSRALVAKNLLP
ncbi:hypothetical protein BC828DRAFT_392142 [Blastocladiella britannica]|nr:hypothetical protein BC828DRAFT_392142 [Blastocladiella britannica]